MARSEFERREGWSAASVYGCSCEICVVTSVLSFVSLVACIAAGGFRSALPFAQPATPSSLLQLSLGGALQTQSLVFPSSCILELIGLETFLKYLLYLSGRTCAKYFYSCILHFGNEESILNVVAHVTSFLLSLCPILSV